MECSNEALSGAPLTFLACIPCIEEFHLAEAAQIPSAIFWYTSAMHALVPVCPVCIGFDDPTLIGAGGER